METIRIALVDDQQIFRKGLALLIGEMPCCSVILQAANGDDCLQQLSGSPELPHVALIDLEMPRMDGIELNSILKKSYPAIRVVILSVHQKPRLIARMIEAGASGYLFKDCTPEELKEAINSTARNGFYMNVDVLKAIQVASRERNKPLKNLNSINIDLSIREREILHLICKEYSNLEMAEKLFISVRTVEGHRNNLLLKTGCHNTAGLVLFAVKAGIIELNW